MKALSLWQPHATLCAIGAKRVETRDWPCPYPLPLRLAIHAAKAKDTLALVMVEPFASTLSLAGFGRALSLPLGKVLAVGDLVACEMMSNPIIDAQLPLERAFGLWQVGRWAWRLERVAPLVRPIAWRGLQKLWELPGSAIDGAEVYCPSCCEVTRLRADGTIANHTCRAQNGHELFVAIEGKVARLIAEVPEGLRLP